MNKRLHIVSFDVPYPPNYGGIIDIYFKIKELHKLGVEIYLHNYLSEDKNEQVALEKYCKKIYYYKRKNIFSSSISQSNGYNRNVVIFPSWFKHPKNSSISLSETDPD